MARTGEYAALTGLNGAFGWATLAAGRCELTARALRPGAVYGVAGARGTDCFTTDAGGAWQGAVACGAPVCVYALADGALALFDAQRVSRVDATLIAAQKAKADATQKESPAPQRAPEAADQTQARASLADNGADEEAAVPDTPAQPDRVAPSAAPAQPASLDPQMERDARTLAQERPNHADESSLQPAAPPVEQSTALTSAAPPVEQSTVPPPAAPPVEQSTAPAPVAPPVEQSTAPTSAAPPVRYRPLSDGEPVDRLPELFWPPEAQAIRPYFSAYLPFKLFDAPLWRFVRVPGQGNGVCCVGYRAQKDRVTQTVFAVRARGGLIPPKGLQGYRYQRGMDGAGYWTLWRNV